MSCARGCWPLVILVLVIVAVGGCGGGTVVSPPAPTPTPTPTPGPTPTPVPTPTPTPIGGNPTIGEPAHYHNGRVDLQQTAVTAYFVALNQTEATAAGTYTVNAFGTALARGRLPAHVAEAGDVHFGTEWQIVEASSEAAMRMRVPDRPWREAQVLAQGSQREFWVCVATPCKWSEGGQAKITATLQAVGTRSHIWVDNRDLGLFPVSRANTIRDVFDAQVWPRVTAVFGKPVNPYNPSPGEGPTTILFTRSVREYGWSGYFFSINLYSDSEAQRWGYRSNEASMFHMAHDMSDTVIHGVNAHEFQHLINYSQKIFVYRTTRENTWINEGLSQVAMDISGYGYQVKNMVGGARLFFENADKVSLYNWGAADAPRSAYYGGAWLVFRYLADRFGNAALTNIVQSPFVGTANLERVLGEPVGRTLVYNGVAMLVSTEGLGLTDPRFTYTSLSLATVGRITYGGTGPKAAKSLGFNFIAVSSGGQPAVRVAVTAGSITPYVGLVR